MDDQMSQRVAIILAMIAIQILRDVLLVGLLFIMAMAVRDMERVIQDELSWQREQRRQKRLQRRARRREHNINEIRNARIYEGRIMCVKPVIMHMKQNHIILIHKHRNKKNCYEYN